jgi:hypothetical protein
MITVTSKARKAFKELAGKSNGAERIFKIVKTGFG